MRSTTMHALDPFVQMSGDSLHLSAPGCCTPVGSTVPTTLAAVKAGVTGLNRHEGLIDSGGEPIAVADVGGLRDLDLANRLGALARRAFAESLAQVAVPIAATVPVFVGVRERTPGDSAWSESIRKALESTAATARMRVSVHLIEEGGAAGSIALQLACLSAHAGRAPIAIAGGVDSFIDWSVLEPLVASDRVHSSTTTYGFCPGEGAAFSVIGFERALTEMGLTPIAKVLSIATAVEPNVIGTPSVCIGEGLTAAIRQSLMVLTGSSSRVGRLIADMNGEPYRGDEFGFSLVRTSERFAAGLEVETPADCWGNVGAATGPLFAILAGAPSRQEDTMSVLTMTLATSDLGYRTAALFCR